MAAWAGWGNIDPTREETGVFHHDVAPVPPAQESNSSWGSLGDVLDDAQRRRQPQGVNFPAPPLPEVRPFATPVMDKKRETAVNWNFSPAAREELYDTPVRLNVRPEESWLAEGGPTGYYRPPGAPQAEREQLTILVEEPYSNKPHEIYRPFERGGEIETRPRATSPSISQPVDATPPPKFEWPSLSAGVLAHEFGHKWDWEHVPQSLRNEYGDYGWRESPQWQGGFPEKFKRSYEAGYVPEDDWGRIGRETYANEVKDVNVPWRAMPPERRDKYFVGLFNDGADRWQEPKIARPDIRPLPPRIPTADILREDPRYQQLGGPDATGAWG